MGSLVRALALLVLCLFSLFAQFETATVLGTVRDATQATVPEANIILENVETGVRSTATSDNNGNFEFFNVRIGRYKLTAEKTGFSRAVAAEFAVTVSARQRVDLTLQVGATAETVTVSGAAAQLETDSSDRGQVVSTRQIVNLPLNGRSYADLALLAPGVRRSALATSGSPRDASFNVNGLRSSLNNFVIDGVDNNAYGTSNQGFSNQVVQLSPDAVAEFRVQTNNYSAEYGRAGGAVINVSMRSGTNAFHGAAWDFLRNTNLNAVGFFKPRENVKPTLIQNQFGVAGGGPIKRDKLFFFADYEGYRRISRTLALSTVPTLEQRAGNIGLPVRNPLTGREYANGIIPASDITPFARKVLAELPAPNREGTSLNLEALPRRTDQTDKGDIRIDYYVNDRFTTFGRYSHRLLNNFEPPDIPGPSGGNSNGNVRVKNWQAAYGGTYSMTPTSVLEARIGISLTEGGKTPIFLGQPAVGAAYGISGLPDDARFAGGLYAQEIGGYTSLGQQSSNPQFQDPFVINPKLNYSSVFGRHSLKAGYEYQRINTEIDDFNPKYGRDRYQSRFSRPAGSTSTNNLYNLSDFLFGLRNSYDLNTAAIANYRQRMHFLYLQDDFKFSPRLTLNMGLRYEYATPQYEADNRLSNFDPSAKKIIQASGGSPYERALVNPDRNNFAPRFGLAYNLTNKTVIRSGYGISYVHFNRLGGENLLAYNLPWVLNPIVNQIPEQGACAAAQRPSNCFRPTQDGYPPNFLDISNVNTAAVRTIYIPKDTRTTYIQSWHFTIQQELAHNLVLDVAYVGTRGNNLVILADYNQSDLNLPGQNLTVDQRRPISNFSQIQIAYPAGWSSYHAFQAKLEQRFSHGFYLLNSFTFSKALDNASGHLETANGDNSRANFRNLPAEKGPSGYDQKFNDTLTAVWDVPGFRQGPLQYALGGWRISQITTLATGTPINLTYSPVSRQQVGGIGSYRPNISGDPKVPNGGPDNYLNPNTVSIVPSDVGNPFGNAGRNNVYGPGLFQIDLGLHKDFALPREGSALQFRTEVFNLLNKTNFMNPDSSRSSNSFGRISSTYIPRQVQFALKFIF